jgi:hypothetical protein
MRVRHAVLLAVGMSAGACNGRTAEPARQRVDASVPAQGAQGYDSKSLLSSGADRPAPESVAPEAAPRDQAGSPQWPVTGDLSPEMIIRTGQAAVEVDSLESALAALRAVAARAGGYVGNTTMQAGHDQARSATLELKVPAARFDELVGGLRPIGQVEFVNVSAVDVGEEFVDISARTANARRLEERLIGILATRTGKLADVLEIERELARVRQEIERYDGRLRYLKAHAAVSTLGVTLHEPSPIVGAPGSHPIREAFRQAWHNFIDVVAAVIAASGVLVPLVVVVSGVVLAGRRMWRRA